MQPNITVLKKRIFIHELEWEIEFTVKGHPDRAYSLHLTPVKYLNDLTIRFAFYRSCIKYGAIYEYRSPFTAIYKVDITRKQAQLLTIERLLNENF